jgi:hypothetical protein
MFKVGDESESLTTDMDGSRGRILTPEAVHERAIHTGFRKQSTVALMSVLKVYRGDSAGTSASRAKELS